MGDGDRRSRPFEAGSRGTLGRRFQAEKGGAQGGRAVQAGIRGKRLTVFTNFHWRDGRNHSQFNTTLKQSLLLFRGGVVVPFVVVVCNGLSCLALIMHTIVQCCTNNVCLAICAVGNTYNK